MDEPNVVNDEEQEKEKEQDTTQSSTPTPPKRPNLRMIGNTAIKTTVNVAKKVMQIFAAMPLPVKIGIAVLIGVIILVCIILEVEAQESSEQVTSSISHVIKNNENISDEAKETYEKYGSLIKMPLETLLEMYDYYIEEGEFSGSDIKKNYTTVIGSNEVEIKEGTGSSSVSGDMGDLVKKAIELAEKGGVIYCQSEREIVSTVDGLNNLKKIDCSAFVYSMYKTFLGIDVGDYTEDTKSKGENHYSESGWTAEIRSIGDGEMQPGDILYRSGHVGIYVGDNKQVDHGGPGSKCACDTDWRGPKHREVSSSYTHYIRYTKQ